MSATKPLHLFWDWRTFTGNHCARNRCNRMDEYGSVKILIDENFDVKFVVVIVAVVVVVDGNEEIVVDGDKKIVVSVDGNNSHIPSKRTYNIP
ncbi:hypothetical protein MTR_3g116870 [Medicago truncatula]|uniref:Uncharacterized protein n=1 Tax=Medicago truncatula TaxID=3880 RepID=G7J746_MEDTR|nr:hypothetical protein MTR_3g116870 [Medicago truncatula]